MDAQITVGQLTTILFAIAGISILVILFKTLLNLNQILSSVNKTIKRNENNIDDTLYSLPKILDNAEKITKSLNEDMQHVSGAIKAVEETVEQTASTIQIINEDVIIPTKDLLVILPIIKSIFTKDKKKDYRGQ